MKPIVMLLLKSEQFVLIPKVVVFTPACSFFGYSQCVLRQLRANVLNPTLIKDAGTNAASGKLKQAAAGSAFWLMPTIPQRRVNYATLASIPHLPASRNVRGSYQVLQPQTTSPR